MVSRYLPIITWPPKHERKRLSIFPIVAIIWLLMIADGYAEPTKPSTNNRISVTLIVPESADGYGYKLQYYVPAPIDVFWLFKTDFDNDLLVTNTELLSHRFIRAIGNSVITENRYAAAPGVRFRWKTIVHQDRYRLEFQLINAKDSRHDFHFGTIQLHPAGRFTRVTQIAYFDFAGVSLWVRFPWNGGMKHTLVQSAKWEQKMASRYVDNIR